MEKNLMGKPRWRRAFDRMLNEREEMPSYTFYDEETGRTFNATMTIAEMEEYLETVPNVKWVPKSGLPTLDAVRLGIRKPDEGFRDILRQVKRKNPRSDVNTF